jgi:hypothetical protein
MYEAKLQAYKLKPPNSFAITGIVVLAIVVSIDATNIARTILIITGNLLFADTRTALDASVATVVPPSLLTWYVSFLQQ